MELDYNSKDKYRFYEVPSLPGGAFAPARVASVILVETEDGEAVLRFIIKRDLGIALKSFVLSYRFSEKPIEEDDPDNPFFESVYTSENINTREYISFRGKVPEGYVMDGCQSFISSVELAEGGKITFSTADFAKNIEDGETVHEDAEDSTATAEAGSAPEKEDSTEKEDTAEKESKEDESAIGTEVKDPLSEIINDSGWEYVPEKNEEKEITPPAPKEKPHEEKPREEKPREEKKAKKRRKDPRKKKVKIGIIAAAICICIAGAGICWGIYYHRTGTQATVDGLLAEKKYTEAFKIAGRVGRSDLQKDVCSEASEYYLEAGDFPSAYAFAFASPDRFSDEIAGLALDKLLDSGADAMDTELFAVAKKLSNDTRFDDSMTALSEKFAKENDYPSAMRAANTVRTASKRTELTEKTFLEGISYYTSDMMYKNAVAFIHSYGKGKTSDGSVSAETVSSIVEHCISNGDKASAVMLSEYFGADYSGIVIDPGEEDVTSMLDSVYPLLTPEQKRSYHSVPFSFYKEPFLIRDGAIEGTDITDAVSAATYEYHTVILHRDGKITSLENGGHNVAEQFPAKEDAVQVAAGLLHTVILYSNGTVMAVGDNTYRQCEVGAWTDIVAVAAGRFFTLGLRSDGTVVAAGSDLCGQCQVSDLRNVKWIGCCDQTAVVGFTDGTVRVRGDVTGHLRDANSFTDVKRISAGGTCIVAEKEDGTVMIADGCVKGSSGNAADLGGATYFAAGEAAIAYVTSEGNIKITGDGAPN